MRITNKFSFVLKKTGIILLVLALTLMNGCGMSRYDMSYEVNSDVSSFRIVNIEEESRNTEPFAANLCVVSSDVNISDVNMSKASGAGLFDLNDKETLYAKNVHEKLYPASLTKIMTALVALDRARLNDTITVTASHMVEGSSMYLKPGEMVTVEELLYGLMLCSGNDAALALADCCGGLEEFVQAMNDKAAELGMQDTSFANPNGLDDEDHYSTARDMAVLAAYAAQNPTFRRICSTRTATVGSRTMTNHNKLLSQVEGCIGMKTGYTKAAGRTLVSCAQRDGCRLVAVTLCDGNDWADHKSLYEMGFAVQNEENTEETA